MENDYKHRCQKNWKFTFSKRIVWKKRNLVKYFIYWTLFFNKFFFKKIMLTQPSTYNICLCNTKYMYTNSWFFCNSKFVWSDSCLQWFQVSLTFFMIFGVIHFPKEGTKIGIILTQSLTYTTRHRVFKVSLGLKDTSSPLRMVSRESSKRHF